MVDLERVLCGVDGSPEGLEAARQGRTLMAPGGTLLGVAVWDPTLAMRAGFQSAEFMKELRDDAEAALQEALEAVPQIETLLVRSRELAGLLAAAANCEADVIAVGMRGRSRALGAALGTVSSGVVHHAPCSVLVARPGGLSGPILLATDGSPDALEAARVAATLAERLETPLTVLEVSESENAGQAAAQALEVCPAAEARTVSGNPHEEIVDIAAQTHSSLVIVGSRGLTGLRALGSVSERVAHRAPCSVLIAREKSHPELALDRRSGT